MTDFNPLAGSILGSSQAQHQIDVEKQRQVRRAQALSKNVAARDEQLEHQVESSDEVTSIHDEQGQDRKDPHQRRRPRTPGKDDNRPHIDVKA